MEALTGRELAIDPTKIHHRWQKDLEPALDIGSGDTVDFDLLMAGDPNIQERNDRSKRRSTSRRSTTSPGRSPWGRATRRHARDRDPLARPGEWGWIAFLPELGLVAEDSPTGNS